MMSCRDVAALANDHVDGRLSRGQRLGVRLHLMMCRHCRRALRQLRATIAVVRSLGARVEPAASPAPAPGEDALLAMFRRERGGGPSG
jgi:anti-sigma factor RsiW